MPVETAFVAARSIAEALGQLADDEEALVLGGGTSIGLLAGQGLIQPSKLVWLGRVPGLGSITSGHGLVTIGAAVTLADLSADPLVRSSLPALAKAAAMVGNPRVRAMATVGGAVAHGDPRQDLLPALLALGTSVRIATRSGERSLPLVSFYKGFMETALRQGEILVAVTVPLVEGQRSEYLRFTPASVADYPTVGAAAALKRSPSGEVAEATVALAGVASVPLLIPLAVAAGTVDLEAAEAAAAEAAQPVGDRLGSPGYKRAMAAVWTRRALVACSKG